MGLCTYSTLLVSSKFSVTSVADRIETAGSRFNKMVETLRLTTVKEGLEDKSEKKSLLTRFVMMPKIPYSIPFDMITMAGKNDISKIYMTGDDLDDFIEKNDNKYMARFSKTTSTYAFSKCETCKGPVLGHKEEDCATVAWTEDDLENIEKMILKSKNFESKFGVVEGINELLVKKRSKASVKTDDESVDDIGSTGI